MTVANLAILCLLATILVFSVIELGLSAWAVSVTDNRRYYGYRSETPGEYSFLLFASLWTLLVVGVLGVLDFLSARKGGISRPYPWLGWATLVLNFITWVFWLAGFSALAAFFGGNPRGTLGALLAFAVMLWLLFTALVVLNALMAFTVLRSDRPSYRPLFSRDGKVSRPTEGPSMTSA